MGTTSTWAFYNSTHSTEITNGRLVYKKDPEEQEHAPYKRFYKILEDSIYYQGPIDKIYYYRHKTCHTDIFNCYTKALSAFSKKYKLNNIYPASNKDLKEISRKRLNNHSETIEDELDKDVLRITYNIVDNHNKLPKCA